jgi:protocatechuate 3,4-dioxygenase beta subunit
MKYIMKTPDKSLLLSSTHLLLLLLIGMFTAVCSGQPSKVAQTDAPWKMVIANQDEPGERIGVSGVVYGADGTTPLPGASVYVYHTDARGYYSGETTNNSNPRLRGTMRTNAEGRYEFETIKPGPYPSARVPSHIHYVVNAPGYREKIFEIVFEGDAFIDDRLRADAAREESIFSIRPLAKDKGGVLRCVQDIRLRRQ